MLCGLRAGWGRSRAAAGPGQALCETGGGGCSNSRALGGEPGLEAEAGAGGATEALAGWDEAGGGRLWGQIASRGGGRGDGCCYCCCGEEPEGNGAVVASASAAAAEWGSGQLGGGAAAGGGMAAPQGYPLSDPGSNSERSADSPLPDDDGGPSSAGPARAHSASPEWGEERFRVDRKKLEAMLQGECPGREGGRPLEPASPSYAG